MGRTLIDLYPEQNGPLERVTSFAKSVGGSPTNVAIAAARLGVSAGMVSRVGDDAFGRAARADLAAEGVDVRQVLTVPGAITSVAVPEISPPNHFPLTMYRGTPPVEMEINEDELDKGAFAASRLLWLSLSGFAAEPSRSAHHRATSVLNPEADVVLDLDYRPAYWRSEADAAALGREAASLATVLIGNMDECRILVGAKTSESAADGLLALGARLAVVKLGADGVLAATPLERIFVQALQVEVVNGLGSGDAFGGAVCDGILSARPLGELVRFANAAGALVAARRGCSSALPTRADVERLASTSRPA